MPRAILVTAEHRLVPLQRLAPEPAGVRRMLLVLERDHRHGNPGGAAGRRPRAGPLMALQAPAPGEAGVLGEKLPLQLLANRALGRREHHASPWGLRFRTSITAERS